jgi:hypothetical protein
LNTEFKDRWVNRLTLAVMIFFLLLVLACAAAAFVRYAIPWACPAALSWLSLFRAIFGGILGG